MNIIDYLLFQEPELRENPDWEYQVFRSIQLNQNRLIQIYLQPQYNFLASNLYRLNCQNVEICSFDKFCEESTFNELKNLIQALERNQLRTESQMKTESWDSDLTLAIQQYQVISDKMQQNKKKLEYNQKIESKPQTLTEPQQIISAANLIDDRSILQENLTQPQRPVVVEKKPEIKSPKQVQIIKPQEQQVVQPLKPENATQSIKTNYSSTTMLSEAELDMKIQNAMKLQNRIFSELGNIKDLPIK